MTKVMDALSKRYGDVVRAKAGGSAYYLVSHPDHVEDVLITNEHRFERVAGEKRVSARFVDEGLFTNEGEAHLRRRDVMEAVMYRDAPRRLAAPIAETAARLRDLPKDGETRDVYAWMEEFKTAIAVKFLFGDEPESPRGAALAELIGRSIEQMDSLFAAFSGLPERFPRLRRKFDETRRRLDGLIYEVIAERRATSGSEDVCSMLIALGDSVPDMRLSDQQLRNELMGLFRGHQAVSTALTWTFHLLAQHPDVESELHAEVDRAIGGTIPDFATIEGLDTTRSILQESLRLLPPAYVLARRCVQEHSLGGFTIPVGAQVLVSEWVTHRDPRYWDEPDAFDPSRFADDRQHSRPPCAYYPQGAGKKMCMGKQLVVPMEGPLLLGLLSERWQLRPAPGSVVELSPKATLKPKSGVPMVLTKRG